MPRRVTPEEAKDLMEKESYAYIDVRSVPEFKAGHPTGAYNVPLNHLGQGTMTPNNDFLAAIEKSFPKDAKLIVACKAGGRSARAAAMLEGAGFTNVADQHAGFDGAMDPATRKVAEPGWKPKGLPVSQEAAPDRTWDSMAAKLGDKK
jgi:rhodanese-related sulfurtransferase